MQTPAWQAPPDPCAVIADTVDVWRLVPDASGHAPAGAPVDWRDSVRGRVLAILGRYVGRRVGPADIAREPGGKPYLRDGALGIGFNLSHTRDLALAAIGPYPRIGVDVERLRPLRRVLPIARRVLSAAEIHELEGLSETARSRRFLQYWTGHEARQKAFGLGILAPAVDPTVAWTAAFGVGDDAWGHVAVVDPGASPRLRFIDDDGL